ncbi:MAG: polyphosphate kinase 2 [Cyclobacteriaceae bacterium]|nr:polyphosphate kinase 2 [Cyclobacteriaceae bacterium]
MDIIKGRYQLSEEEIKLINTPIGLRYLLGDKKLNVERAIRMARYEYELRGLQAKLIDMQNWTINEGKKILILFEGRDAAGKGGAIRRVTAHINPRNYRVVALPRPTNLEKGQWYFQRYVERLPKPGEMVLFDRSWYNRAVVEPVNGFCTEQQYQDFMGQVNEFERMLQVSGTYLIKFYFSISKEEQARRFHDIQINPLKRWKMTAVDRRAQELWDQYTLYKEKMFEKTNTKNAPWIVISADSKPEARLEVVRHILDYLPYES